MTNKHDLYLDLAKRIAKNTGNYLLATLVFSNQYRDSLNKNYSTNPDEFTRFREGVRELERIAEESGERLEKIA